MPEARLVSVHVGKVAPLGRRRVASAFVKHAVEGEIAVVPLGLAGDEQADHQVHGGPEKAVYGYAARHYAAWAAEFPELAPMFAPGAVGENLALGGIDESDICVGDVHAIGGAKLQVCQPRQPCFKLTLRFGQPLLGKAMTRNGRAGWYYRVLRTGAIRAGDRLTLEDRPYPDFAFARLVEIVNFGGATNEENARMADMAGLATKLREKARERL